MSSADVLVLNNVGGGQSVQVPNLPVPGESVKGTAWKYNIDSGKGPNSAICMARLGVSTAFIGKSGVDDAGKRADTWMREAGVDTSGLIMDPNVRTGQGIRIMGPDGRHMVICGESCSWALTEEEVFAEMDRHKEAKYFFTGLEIRYSLAEAAMKHAKELGMTTVFNLSPVPPAGELKDLSFADYVAVNEVEGAQLAGIADWHELSPKEIMERIIAKYNCGCVLLTLGAEGSAGLKDGRYWRIPKADVTAIDTIGAGDSFLSAFTVNLVWGKDPESACRWANEFAGFTTTREGSIPSYPLLAEVKEYVERRINES